MITEYAYDIGWTEAQEMNAGGWRITVKGYRPDGCLEWIHILPYTEELAFNETVREFTKSHDNVTFNAKGTGGCK